MADETPPSTGQEIGAALSQALGQAFLGLERSQERLLGGVERSQEALARLLAAALAEAARCEAPPNAPQAPNAPRRWHFSVERDAKGLMTGVVARAE